MPAMRKASTPPNRVRRLTPGEQRALASFLAGRLPAGRLNDELCRAREAAQTDSTPALNAA
jgi:hypothetical protein